MRRLLLATAAPLLLGQGAHYEHGTLIAPAVTEHMLRTPRYQERIPTLAFTPPGGRRRLLDLPPELDGRLGRCIRISRHQGITCAVGFAHTPLPPGKAVREAMKQHYFQQPRRLYTCGPDGRWKLEARLDADTTHRRWLMWPLGEGRFLYGNPQLCWQGDAVSPFGVYRAEGGRLHLERLVDLGLGGPWYQAVPFPPGTEEARRYGRQPKVGETYRELEGHPEAWQVLSLPSGLCFLHRKSRRWFLLDNQATRCLAQGRVGSAEPAELLGAAVRPDGRVLIATRSGSSRDRLRALMAKGSIYDMLRPRKTPAEELLTGRSQALHPPLFPEEEVQATWQVLDPVRGRSWGVAPPLNLPIRLDGFAFGPLDLTVLPDGRLHLGEDDLRRPRPSRLRYDWLDRLLKPFTHDWRKLEP